MKLCDLHTHSCYSDGTWTPEQLVTEAERLGLSAIALCDHNTVSGLPEFLRAAENAKVKAIPGVELSTQYADVELHILGLFITPDQYGAVTALMERFLRDKEQSNRRLIERLNRAGLQLDYDKIQQQSAGYVNRAVIAAEMTKLGYTESVQQAFRQWLSEGKGYYQPPRRLDPVDAIRFIKSIGAVAVLAHPFLNLDEPALREFLPKAVEAGLDGMETIYSKFTPEQTQSAKNIAAEFGLLESGGSDFHGDNKPDIRIGVGRGDLQIPDAFWQALHSRVG